MTKPGNYGVFFVNGNDRKTFQYTPGTTPYYVELNYRQRNVRTTSWSPITLLVWANNKSHVCQIIKELAQFQRDCRKEYMRNIIKRDQHNFDNIRELMEYVALRTNKGDFRTYGALTMCCNTFHRSNGSDSTTCRFSDDSHMWTLTISEVDTSKLVVTSFANN